MSGIDGVASVALYGLGGVGKTQLALHFAHSQRKEYEAILWFRCETAEALRSSFSQAAVDLQLPDVKPDRVHENHARLLAWLQQTGKHPMESFLRR